MSNETLTYTAVGVSFKGGSTILLGQNCGTNRGGAWVWGLIEADRAAKGPTVNNITY